MLRGVRCDVLSICPITVKKALRKAQGVSDVMAKYEGGGVDRAKVAYDPAKVGVQGLTHATAQAGYTSRLRP